MEACEPLVKHLGSITDEEGAKEVGDFIPLSFQIACVCQHGLTLKQSAHACSFVALSSVCIWIPAGVSKFRSQLQSFPLHFLFT